MQHEDVFKSKEIEEYAKKLIQELIEEDPFELISLDILASYLRVHPKSRIPEDKNDVSGELSNAYSYYKCTYRSVSDLGRDFIDELYGLPPELHEYFDFVAYGNHVLNDEFVRDPATGCTFYVN